ncbi:MAG: hypothetical protein AAFX94_16815, partial [Myxococcota bacterium]
MMKHWSILASILLATPAFAQDGAGKTKLDLTLEQAYKKEFAFLVGQQRQLEGRIKSIEQRNKREYEQLQGDIGRLENRL